MVVANKLNDTISELRQNTGHGSVLTVKGKIAVPSPIEWLESSVKLFRVGFYYFLGGFWEIFHESS